jgi:hypothetical protein
VGFLALRYSGLLRLGPLRGGPAIPIWRPLRLLGTQRVPFSSFFMKLGPVQLLHVVVGQDEQEDDATGRRKTDGHIVAGEVSLGPRQRWGRRGGLQRRRWSRGRKLRVQGGMRGHR